MRIDQLMLSSIPMKVIRNRKRNHLRQQAKIEIFEKNSLNLDQLFPGKRCVYEIKKRSKMLKKKTIKYHLKMQQ